jgi:virginiamycin B lyase
MKPVFALGTVATLAAITAAALLFGMSPSADLPSSAQTSRPSAVNTSALVAQMAEFPLIWPKGTSGSTHELTYNRAGGSVFWVTGQTHDSVARVTLEGQPAYFPMPDNSGPHGIEFDAAGNLWVTLEFAGLVVQLDPNTGAILRQIDVALHAEGATSPINTHPHGLGVAPDGITLWFTGKATGTVGRIDPDGSVHHFSLPTVGSVPIYIAAGPDGAMWCTELVGNKIARITQPGVVTEYSIPTYNSRPIAIIPGPDGRSMWFSEEAGNKIGRIDTVTGTLVEYPVPMLHANTILASLAFDTAGNLWTQAYVNPNNASPSGSDAIVKLDAAITLAPVTSTSGDISSVPITFYETSTQDTVMHRITQGPDGAMWFTELATDKLGRLEFIDAAEAKKRPTPARSKTTGAKSTPQTTRSLPELCG